MGGADANDADDNVKIVCVDADADADTDTNMDDDNADNQGADDDDNNGNDDDNDNINDEDEGEDDDNDGGDDPDDSEKEDSVVVDCCDEGGRGENTAAVGEGISSAAGAMALARLMCRLEQSGGFGGGGCGVSPATCALNLLMGPLGKALNRTSAGSIVNLFGREFCHEHSFLEL